MVNRVMKYLLGVDFGGGASKATLVSHDGVIVATASTEYPTIYPQPGYTEQDPAYWYRAVKENIAEVLKKSGISPTDITAVCLDAATHTTVLLDENFNVIRNAIYWTDSRSIQECEFLKNNYSNIIFEQALHMPDTIWTLPQLMWIKKNEPNIWAKTKHILFPKDYIRFLLTNEYCTDYIEAQGSMMFDNNKMSWSKELCGILGFDIENLPPIVKPTDVIGAVTKKAALDTGLAQGTKVVCGTTDTALEVFAAGGIRKGNMTIKLATAGRICVVTDKAYPDENIINYSHVIDGLWYPGTATKSCAASYRWYRDTFGGDYKELDKLAEGVDIGAKGLMFHPYLNGELTPYSDPMLKASFVGVHAGHTKAHFTRAVLEGVAMSLLDCKKTLEQLNISYDNQCCYIIGGGSQSNLWRQIIADALDIVLVKTENSDSSFGAAMLAGVATGIFDNFEQVIERCTKTVSVTNPIKENTQKYGEMFEIYKYVQAALSPIYRKMNP